MGSTTVNLWDNGRNAQHYDLSFVSTIGAPSEQGNGQALSVSRGATLLRSPTRKVSAWLILQILSQLSVSFTSSKTHAKFILWHHRQQGEKG